MVVVGDSFYHVKYGDYFVVEVFNAKKVLIRFANTGYSYFTQSDKIKKGIVKDVMHPFLYGVGYYGVKQRSLKNPRKAYDAWNHMMYRCYSEKAKVTHPTYKDCFVCEEWHNFSAFYAWYTENYIDGYELDKDIKIKGNKIYSPNTCTFVSPRENKQNNAKEYAVLDPSGNVLRFKNMAKFCKENKLSHGNMSMVVNGKRISHKGYKALE